MGQQLASQLAMNRGIMQPILDSSTERLCFTNNDLGVKSRGYENRKNILTGILLVLGLFTRFAAAAVVIFMIMGVKFTSAKGFFWTQGGSEYALLIGFCALFFLIRGGGAWSLDRAIGREL